MKTSDLLAMCLRNLTRRKFRTFLTVMGVVIGTCAIVVMISLGVGISVAQEQFLSSMGDLSVIEVNSYGSGTGILLDDAAVDTFKHIPGVTVATPLMRFNPDESWMQIYAGRKERYAAYASYSIIGIDPEAMEELGITIAQGESFSSSNSLKKIQILFGPRLVYDFQDTKRKWPNNYIDGWPDENGNLPEPFFQPMDETYTLRVYASNEKAKDLDYPAEVIGILDAGNYDYDILYSGYMDINLLKQIKLEYEKENNIKRDRDYVEQYETVKVKVGDLRQVGEVQTTIEDMGFYCWSLNSIREQLEQNAQQTQLILGILGGVSLFVAAISITNTMIMSVYERTREIGVMKVLGCLVGNIRTIFLVEAGLIGFIGGILGIAFSYLLSFLLNTFGDILGSFVGNYGMDTKVSVIPPWLVLLGLVFATLIGLFSGFQPANRAVKISALEAIKTE